MIETLPKSFSVTIFGVFLVAVHHVSMVKTMAEGCCSSHEKCW